MAFQPPGPTSGSSSSSGFQHNSPSGDTTLTKVFVGGLAWETQSETMRQYFEQFGEIFEAVVITDKNTGRSKGYGFVTFQDPESARRACVDPAPVIDGRRANCNLASLGRPRHSLPFGSLRFPWPYFGSYGYQQQQPVPYGYHYQPGLTYPSYTYATFGPEYAASYQQQMYYSTQLYPYSQSQTPAAPLQNYTQPFGFGNPNSSIHPSPTGVAAPIQLLPALPHFIQGPKPNARGG